MEEREREAHGLLVSDGSDSGNYYRLRVKSLTGDQEELFSFLCFDRWGALGVSEVLSYHQKDLAYDPTPIFSSNHDLDVYFASSPPEGFFREMGQDFPDLQMEIYTEENKDWLSEWKKDFRPFRFVGDYWVVPSWLPSPVSPELTLRVDPGMAFGTGTHATTQMAAYLVMEVCRDPGLREGFGFKGKGVSSGLRWLDVGMGTGILSLLLERLGARKVVGIEIDPEARRVARENLGLNPPNPLDSPNPLTSAVFGGEARAIVIEERSLDDYLKSIERGEDEGDQLVEGPPFFEALVANIIDSVLVDLRPLLEAFGTKVMVVSGILLEQEEEFLKNFVGVSDFSVHQRLEFEGWVAFWLVRNT